MANPDAPFGLRPVRTAQGNPYNGQVNLYFAPSTYATDIFIGDAVVVTTAGSNTATVTTGSGSYAPRTLQEVNRATVGNGNAITGVVVGFDADPSNLDKVYGAASTNRVLKVCDDPYMIFEIQADGVLTATQVGLNAVLIDTHSGDTNTGLSGTELDTTSSAPAADASNQLTIVGLVDRADQDTTASTGNMNAYVRINNHTNAHGVVGV